MAVEMSPQDHPWLFVLAFPLMWCAACYLLAVLGGWVSLGRLYRLDRRFAGETWHFRSGQFRYVVSYGNMLTLGASTEGMYLSVLFLFRAGHPALLVPWSAVRKGRRGLFNILTTPLYVGERPSVRVSISTRLVRKMEDISGHTLASI